MKRVAKLLNDLVDAGVVTNHAVFGAVAQMRHTEAVVTMDADVLVTIPDPDALAMLRWFEDETYLMRLKNGHSFRLRHYEFCRMGDRI